MGGFFEIQEYKNKSLPYTPLKVISTNTSLEDGLRLAYFLYVGWKPSPFFASSPTPSLLKTSVQQPDRTMDSMKNAFLASLPLRPRQPDDANSHPADKDERVNGDSSSVQTDQDEFFPSIWDVLRVRHILQWKVIESFPTELVDEIIDEAEYWPSNLYHTATSPDDKRNQRNRTIIRQDRDKVLLKTVPLCYDEKVSSLSSTI